MRPSDDELARRELTRALDVFRGDPRAALRLPAEVTAADVRRAFRELAKRYHPARFAQREPAVVRLANEVFLAMRDAHDALLAGLEAEDLAASVTPPPAPARVQTSPVLAPAPRPPPVAPAGPRPAAAPPAPTPTRGRAPIVPPAPSMPVAPPPSPAAPRSTAASVRAPLIPPAPTTSAPVPPMAARAPIVPPAPSTPAANVAPRPAVPPARAPIVPPAPTTSAPVPPAAARPPIAPAATPAPRPRTRPATIPNPSVPAPVPGPRPDTVPPAEGRSTRNRIPAPAAPTATAPTPAAPTPAAPAPPRHATPPTGAAVLSAPHDPRRKRSSSTVPGKEPLLSPTEVKAAADAATLARQRFDRALDAIRRQRWHDARVELELLAAAAPADTRYRAYLHYVSGWDAYQLGRDVEARGEWQKALACDPGLGMARWALESTGIGK